MKKLTILALSAVVLAGCSSTPEPTPVKTDNATTQTVTTPSITTPAVIEPVVEENTSVPTDTRAPETVPELVAPTPEERGVTITPTPVEPTPTPAPRDNYNY